MKYRAFPQYLLTFCLSLIALCLALPALAADRGEGQLDPSQPTGITVDEIVQKFAAKEKQFKTAREQYTYRQSVTVQTLDGDTVDGEYKQVDDILFDDKGKRLDEVVFAPQSTLQRIQMTREDFDDINRRMPFVLTSDEIPDYQILYAGKQKEDELGTYVFDIAPKQIDKNKRYFQGRIWVDDHDFQIVKTYGKNVPDIGVGKKRGGQENLFPNFTTWRQQIDNKYWFPVYTKVDDELHFSSGDVHVRQVVKYSNYKRFGSNVKITYEGQEISKDQPGTQQPGTQQPPSATPPAPPKK
jgi:hypothetical protein